MQNKKIKFISRSPQETIKIAQRIASQLKGGEVICFYGELGSGKTTFVRGLIQYFLPTERILSPTFIIVRHYEIRRENIRKIYHLDLYRIEKSQEIENLGFKDFLTSDSIVAIEWAEKIKNLLPAKRIDVCIKEIEKDVRLIEIASFGIFLNKTY